MSLGNQRTNGNGVRRFDSTFYSRMYVANYKENTRINITYASGMIKLTIATSQTPDANNNRNWEDQITVSITGNKANLLLNALKDYEKAIKDETITLTNSWGIVTGLGEIQTVLMFHLNKIGNGKALSICSIDANGATLKKCTFNFPDEQDFYIAWENFDSMRSDKVFDNGDMQYKLIKTAIEEFARTCNGAAGYNTWDIGRYEVSSIKNTVNAMAESMGIQQRQNSNYNRNTGGGYFSNNNNNNSNYNRNNQGTSQHKSLDEIQQEYIEDDED